MKAFQLKALATLTLTGLVAACAPDGRPSTADAAPADLSAAAGAPAAANVVTVTAGDFYYQAPQTIPSGLTTLRLMNSGTEFHHVQLIRIGDGHTLQEMIEYVSAAPDAKDGKPHIAHGMVNQIRVGA